MSTFSWRVDNGDDGVDHLPACSSCRRRKLRCSRSGPPCTHCERLGTTCVYDAKQKPGLKPGAVELLSRRVALLEKILLDEHEQPLISFDKYGNVFGQISPRPNQGNQDQAFAPQESCLTRVNLSSATEQRSNETQNIQMEDRAGFQSAKLFDRRPELLYGSETDHDGSMSESDSINSGLERALPSTDVLLLVAQYFCLSFHHWIPFLHKARWLRQIEDGSMDKGDLLVLHAAVGVALQRAKVEGTFSAMQDVDKQARTSRALVLKHAMAEMSLKHLMALVILVFCDLNDGQLFRSYGSVGYLTKTLDFLQLSVEEDASRSKALMRPLRCLSSTSDWTELESRRRLFWCVFMIDRFTSATTGLNTSVTAEDVNRRLPADGYYFAAEKQVSCPFFGLWNKKYAKLDVSLTAHIPAQYSEGDGHTETATVRTPSTEASFSSAVDASRLGAFAYCVEATESLNQITTFFLQQCIDWENRQDVVNWLTRFKELDLRLVHWKQLLPSRWKDSNRYVDKSLVDMDPNLTLAHMTHNTSMILLHYSIACPPTEWSSLIKLPSSCSAETCHLAAIEISQIAGKFLQHTRIPIVNSQFSFCLLVAAKVLLALSQAMKQPVDDQFELIMEALWLISARWNMQDLTADYKHTCRGQETRDLAADYAQFLEKLRDRCDESDEYRFDLLDHSCSNLGHVPHTPLNNITQAINASGDHPRDLSGQLRKRTRHSSTKSHRAVKRARDVTQSPATDAQHRGHSPTEPIFAQSNIYSSYTSQSRNDAMPPPLPRRRTTNEGTALSQNGNDSVRTVPSESHSAQTMFNDIPNWVTEAQMWYTDHDTETLMGPDFTDLDRVITFEDATFHTFDFTAMQ